MILDTWRHTDGGPATNFLAGWKSSSLVVSIDLDFVATGGKLLAVWGSVHRVPRANSAQLPGKGGKFSAMPTLGRQIERTARPLIKNALVGGPLAPEAVSNRRKEAYNRVGLDGWIQFSRDIDRTLGLYDGFDGTCGNQWLADTKAEPSKRYQKLASPHAADRIWENSASATCTQFLAVEFTALRTPGALPEDCGGGAPKHESGPIFPSPPISGTRQPGRDGPNPIDSTPPTKHFHF